MGKRVTEDQDTIILNIEVPAGMRAEATTTPTGSNDTLILNLGLDPQGSQSPIHREDHQAWPAGGYPVYLAPVHNQPHSQPHDLRRLAKGPVNQRAQNAMSLGITSLALSFLPLFGTVSWLLAPVGISKSSRALVEAEASGEGHAEAVTGIVTSLSSLLICLAWVYQLWP